MRLESHESWKRNQTIGNQNIDTLKEEKKKNFFKQERSKSAGIQTSKFEVGQVMYVETQVVEKIYTQPLAYGFFNDVQ